MEKILIVDDSLLQATQLKTIIETNMAFPLRRRRKTACTGRMMKIFPSSCWTW